MEKQFNALIVGAGNIGAFFDTPQSEDVLTHAHAFSKIKGFNLLGFVDISEEKGKKAAELWNTNYYSSLEEVFNENKIDVISICVPDQYHYEIFKKVLNFPVKLIFAEKPLAKNLKQAEELIKISKEKNVKCLVNYSRRFVDEFKILRENILSGEYGEFICGTSYYGKGTLHNGSHLIDFLRYMLGEIKETKVFNYKFDFYNDDPSVSSVLTLKNGGNFIIQNIPCSNYTIFEAEVLFTKKRIRIIDSGFKVEEYSLSESEIFKGYVNLFKDKEYNTELGKSMENAVMSIYDYLQYNKNLQCTLEDAYIAMKVCEKLKSGIKYE